MQSFSSRNFTFFDKIEKLCMVNAFATEPGSAIHRFANKPVVLTQRYSVRNRTSPATVCRSERVAGIV